MKAQNTNNPIDQYYYPTYNSDFLYFFLRKDMRLNEGLVGFDLKQKDEQTTLKSKLFIPVFDSKKWNYVLPIYYDSYEFKSSDSAYDFNSEMRFFFFQSVLNYYPTNNLSFSSIIEVRIKGNEYSQFEKTGNQIAHYFVARYQFTDKFAVAPGFLVGYQWHTTNTNIAVFPSFEFKWNPNPKVALMAGVPGLLGFEWSAPKGFEAIIHCIMDDGEVFLYSSLRKRFNKRFDITLRYNLDGYSNTYIPQTEFQTYTYNQIKQTESFLATEFSFRPSGTILLQLKSGYNLDSKVQLYYNDDKIVDINGSSGLFWGISAFIKFKN